MRKGHGAIVKELIQAGADANLTDQGGSSNLHVAAGQGHDAMVKFFVLNEDIN